MADVEFNTLSVLIVDDSRDGRAQLWDLLNGIGVRDIRQAEDADQALQAMRSFQPSLVFCSLEMRPVDGIAFTRRLRTAADSPNPYVDVIALTGVSDRDRVLIARDAGVSAFLVKPPTADALVSRIEMLLTTPRKFVRTRSYVGPDRRRFRTAPYGGPERRRNGD